MAAQEPPVPGAKVRVMFTPLALALIMVETTDVIVAVDSTPAIFAITADPFLVFARPSIAGSPPTARPHAQRAHARAGAWPRGRGVSRVI
jgi:hypothetical protein